MYKHSFKHRQKFLNPIGQEINIGSGTIFLHKKFAQFGFLTICELLDLYLNLTTHGLDLILSL